MVDEFNCNKLLRKRLGFRRTPPRSTMWWHAYRLQIGLLDDIVVFTAGAAVRRTLMANSSSYTYDRYEQDSNGRWVRRTVKHRILLTMDGCVAASAVTDGDWDRPDGQRIPAGRPQVLLQGQLCRVLPHRPASVHEAPIEPRRTRAQRMGQHDKVGASTKQ